MRLINQGSNQHVLEIGNSAFLFSYQTLVACVHEGKLYRPAETYSPTTSRHVRAFIASRTADTADTLLSYEHQRIQMAYRAMLNHPDVEPSAL